MGKRDRSIRYIPLLSLNFPAQELCQGDKLETLLFELGNGLIHSF